MLYSLISELVDQYSFLNVFRYLTFRTGLAMFTSMIIVLLVGTPFIKFFSARQILDPIRENGPSGHIVKKIGTPTMGGVLILLGLFSGILLWGDLSNYHIWFLLYIVTSFGLLGAYDDYKKIKFKNSSGISSRFKLIAQIIIATIGLFGLSQLSQNVELTNLYFPFFKDLIINLGWFFIPFSIFIIVGSSNAVNLTDGLDGLATVPVILVAGCFAFISYVTGNIIFSEYLNIPYLEGMGEVSVFCGSIIGACLGFLWFNAPPAKIFMGDTGSLALGGSLGAIGIITKHEIVLAIIGGLFVLEAVSVIVQVISFKLTGKRVFRMAPIHHHFEKKGWAESTVVIRFWIIAIILAMIGLATLKLR
jgi:phospho-N-acetylmuramoyl-pentapeptide-transferase